MRKRKDSHDGSPVADTNLLFVPSSSDDSAENGVDALMGMIDEAGAQPAPPPPPEVPASEARTEVMAPVVVPDATTAPVAMPPSIPPSIPPSHADADQGAPASSTVGHSGVAVPPPPSLPTDSDSATNADEPAPASSTPVATDSTEDAATLARSRARFGTCEEEGQGGLARAVMPNNDGELGALEAEGDATQGGVVGARVGEVDVGEGQGQGGRGLGPFTRVHRAGGRLQEWVPARVEGDAAEDGAEEPAGGEDQEGHADEARDGDPDPPPVDEPLAELVARVDEAAGMGDVADEFQEAVEGLLDAFEAEGAQVGQDPEGDAGADTPDEAEAGGDGGDGEP